MFKTVLKHKRSLLTHVLLAGVAVGVRKHILRVVQVNPESTGGVGVVYEACSQR